MPIFRRRWTDQQWLTFARGCGADIPDTDQSIVARCTVDARYVDRTESNPYGLNGQGQWWGRNCQMLLTNSRLVLLAETHAESFELGNEIQVPAMNGRHTFTLVQKDRSFFFSTGNERDMVLFRRLFDITSD